MAEPNEVDQLLDPLWKGKSEIEVPRDAPWRVQPLPGEEGSAPPAGAQRRPVPVRTMMERTGLSSRIAVAWMFPTVETTVEALPRAAP